MVLLEGSGCGGDHHAVAENDDRFTNIRYTYILQKVVKLLISIIHENRSV